MSFEVEIVGGPRDGQVIAIEGRTVRLAEPMSPSEALMVQEARPTMGDVSVWSLPVRLTRNGYRAYWQERS